MDEGDRKKLYTTLLTSLARSIREAPGSCDKIGHDWSEWHQSIVQHDTSDVPLAYQPGDMICDAVFRTKAERKCLQCGLEQVST